MGVTNVVVILCTVFMSACAQLMLKIGATTTLGPHQPADGPVALALRVLFSPMIMGGIFTYGVSVLIWIWVLSRVELSVAYPFVGLSFIFTLVFGIFFLGETFNTAKLIGTLMITAGCVFIAQSTSP
jgi:multidrug transporter EmrE-like cation transporter